MAVHNGSPNADEAQVAGGEATPEMPGPMLTFDEAMGRLSLSRSQLYRQVKDGALAAVKGDAGLQFAELEVCRFEAKRSEDQAALREARDEWLEILSKRLAEHGETPLPELEGKPEDELMAELVRRLLLDAVIEQVSDVHIDPVRTDERLLYRYEGNVKEVGRLPSPLASALKAKLKDMVPTPAEGVGPVVEGLVRQTFGESERQMHIQVAPTLLGEHVHVHVYDPEEHLRLDTLGYTPKQIDALGQLLTGRPGLILVAGAADFAAERHRLALATQLTAAGRLVVSLEHRVHSRSEFLVQLEVGRQEGLAFDAVSRIALDMSPDVVLIDTVRDADEALGLLQIASAGALVVADIQAASGVDALLRLTTLGASREGLAQTLLGIVERRSLRRLCPRCRTARTLDAAGADELRVEPSTEVHEPGRCDFCGDGFLGWRMIYGLLLSDGDLAELIRSIEPPALPVIEWFRRNPLSLHVAAREAVLAGDVCPGDATALLSGLPPR